MMPPSRSMGVPSPLQVGTHDANHLPDAVAPDGALLQLLGDDPMVGAPVSASLALEGVADAAAGWLGTLAKLIRPISVGALMAIPTVGPAVVGIVAFFSPGRAMAMVQASTGFLQALPTDVVALIAVLATGYGVARSFDKLKKAEP